MLLLIAGAEAAARAGVLASNGWHAIAVFVCCRIFPGHSELLSIITLRSSRLSEIEGVVLER